ncbi:DMT family transporter [Epibacterium ulvae]|uniref:Permease of the drug/metabolite transporter (DMT) superfamily n=1 Tax=Epibacterium ulvae TaxID=1156985 RepID=A0A1G5R618_9RHOB|nr:DMT family transporter [Epibacterium ulvae]SCZ69525.1 Permease of the drug/metabolite transporter (DMT) superfamily [Epibacterium ulvae]
MTQNNTRRGILLMVLFTVIMAIMDALSRHLASEYNVLMVVMIRYWFLLLLVVGLAASKAGGIRRVARTQQPKLQIFRGFILAAEICVMVLAFTLLGLVQSHAVFVSYPLLIAALSGPLLGEAVGWRRWSAIAFGFLGVIVILQPGSGVFQLSALVPLLAALMFALYGLLTRYVSREDSSETSFFYMGVVGFVVLTPLGLWQWQPMIAADWGWMAALAVAGALGHWVLIKCYEAAEASAVQPFAYLQLPVAAIFGLAIFGETLAVNVAIGAAIVVGAGLFTLWRERLQR